MYCSANVPSRSLSVLSIRSLQSSASGRASTTSSAQPWVSIIHSIFSACGMRKSGSST
jgi:hypothetical protein